MADKPYHGSADAVAASVGYGCNENELSTALPCTRSK